MKKMTTQNRVIKLKVIRLRKGKCHKGGRCKQATREKPYVEEKEY